MPTTKTAKKKEKKKYTPGITQRLLTACEEAIQRGEARNKTEFFESIGEYQQNIYAMEKGIRAPTLEQIVNACIKYELSPEWLLLNRGRKKARKEEEKPVESRLSDIEVRLSRLERLGKKK